MDSLNAKNEHRADQKDFVTTEIEVANLVGEVYETAPPTERGRLLEQLLRPLGALSLVAVANGVFAKIWFQSRYQQLNVRIEDTQVVRASDVIALVDYVEQVSSQTVDGVAQWLAGSPALASSSAAVLLAMLLMKRAQGRSLPEPRSLVATNKPSAQVRLKYASAPSANRGESCPAAAR